jgi:hypothetical protein
MIPMLFRAFGSTSLAAALVVLNYDCAKTLDARALHITKLGEAWHAVSPDSLLLLQPAIERHVAVWLWDPVVQTILEQPTWLTLGVLGAILMVVGRRSWSSATQMTDPLSGRR